MIVTYAANSNAWIASCGKETSNLHLEPTGFRWSERHGLWFTRNPAVADALRSQCSDRARRAIKAMRRIRPFSGACSARNATRVEDLFYAAGWSTWALVERRAGGVESPIGEVPLRGPLEPLARRFGRLIAERLGSWELHWLSDVSEIIEDADDADPWVVRWHAASEAERIDLDQRAFEIAVQTVLHGHSNAAKGTAGRPHRSRSKVPPVRRNAREQYATFRAMERTYAYQMRRLGEPEVRGSGEQGEAAPDNSAVASMDPSRDERCSSATIHYLHPHLHDDRWWKR
jgi:hypothetical protein